MADIFSMLAQYMPSREQIVTGGIPLLGVAGLAVGGILLYLSREKIWNLDIVRSWRYGNGIPFLIKGNEWPNVARLYEDRAGGTYSETDNGKYVNDLDLPEDKREGYEFWELYNLRCVVPAPELKDMAHGPNGEAIAHFYCPSRGSFYPMRILTKITTIKDGKGVYGRDGKSYVKIEDKEIEVIRTLKGYLPVYRGLYPMHTVNGQALPPDSEDFKDAVDIKLHPVLSENMKMAYRLQIDKNKRMFAKQKDVDTLLMYGGFMLLVIACLLWMTVNNNAFAEVAKPLTGMLGPLTQIGQAMPDFIRVMNNTINAPRV